MLTLVKTLCQVSGVSGWEDETRDYIREQVMPYADEIREDAVGNLMIFQKGTHPDGRTLMLCAHMDEVGFIVKNITDEGFLRFGCVGGIDPRVLLGRRVTVGPAKRPGVIGVKASHLLVAEERKKTPKVTDMYIDIGARDRAQAEEWVSPGDACAFYNVPEEFGRGLLMAKAIDDRLGCACLMRRIAEEQPLIDTWTVFSAQEEVGTRGAFAAGYAIGPDVALIVEGTTAADRPDIPPHKQVCRPGGGVVIPVMDRGTIYDAALVKTAIAVAEREGIPWQYKEFVAGGTDAAAIHLSRAGVPTVAMAAAVRYLHSACCVASTEDFTSVYRLLRALAREVEEKGFTKDDAV